MTATDELRKLLDERGVEWEQSQQGGWYTTEWTGRYGKCNAMEWKPALTVMMPSLTPEQAVAATLGSEREKQLELLVKQLWYLVNHRSGYGYAAALESIEELGLEVDE